MGAPSGVHYDARYGEGWTYFNPDDEQRAEDLASIAENSFTKHSPLRMGLLHSKDEIGNLSLQ